MLVNTPAEIAVERAVPGYLRSMAVKGVERAVAASRSEEYYYVCALELWQGEDGEIEARIRWSQSHQDPFSAGRAYEKLERPLRQEMAEAIPSSTDPEEAGPFEAELLKREQLEMALELGRWQGSRQEPEEN